MIQIYLVQHGIALTGEEDPQRPLSELGRDQLQTVAKHLQAKKIRVSKIAHSGKLRALQSAEIMARILDIKKVTAFPGMNPKDDVEAFIEKMDEDGVMYVGHLPHLEQVVSKLICGSTLKSVIQFQNAAVACLQLNDRQAQLVWYLPPSLC